MIDYREILRRRSLGENITQIAAALHSSRNTVREVLRLAEKKGVQWPLSDELTNEKLRMLFYPERIAAAKVYLPPDCPWIYEELPQKGVNLTLLWKEYQKKCLSSGRVPYQYTQFCDIYRNWARKSKATMRIDHKPGDVMEVDWAGGTLPITDPVTGEATAAYLFVAVLPCSCYAYAELCADMKTEAWLDCHIHAYEFFDGVARLLIPDNLKTGVTKNTKYETVINRSYSDLAEYYGAAIVPARVHHPKDKSPAEGTVKYATTWILASLRNQIFFSLSDAQEAVNEKLKQLNDAPFQKRKGNRREAYLLEEKEFMQPLPLHPYEPAIWSEQTVLLDYTVSDGLNKYSVPYDLIGEQVSVRTTHATVEIFFHGSRVASHPRSRKRRRAPVIDPKHMPENHRKYLEYTPEKFREWAQQIGENTNTVVRYFLESGRAPEQGLKSCVSLRKYADKYSKERIEEACRQILTFDGEPSIKGLSILLKNPIKTAQRPTFSARRRGCGITRGVNQFRGGEKK